MANDAALSAALDAAVARYVDAPNDQCKAHRAYIGYRKVNGVYTDDVAVVVCVPEKLPRYALSAEEVIPHEIYTAQGAIPVDVQAAPPAEIKLLHLVGDSAYAAGSLEHQRCQEPLVRGGSQIQPRGASWVGTLGGMLVSDGHVIAVTNAHVTGLTRAANWPMHQPAATNPHYFSLVRRVVPITMGRNGRNVVDLAILDPRDKDGKHRCTPEQIGLGKLGTKAVDAKLGMQVVKSGRTTGNTKGRCVGVKGVSQVGYDAGKVGRFVDQNVFSSDDGSFSAAGDSGSMILEAGTNNFVALLFAGSGSGRGSDTIGNPSHHVLAAAKATMFPQ